MMFIRTDNTPLKFIQKLKRLNVFVYFRKQWKAAIFPHEKKKSFLAEKKFCGEVIMSCVETSVHARKPCARLKKISRMQEKNFMQNSHEIHVKFTQNSRKNYIIETRKIKKVYALYENRQTSAATVLYYVNTPSTYLEL